MEDDQFRILLEYLQYSWTGYRKVRKGVKKRIQRHMQQMGCRNVMDYLMCLLRQIVTCCELRVTCYRTSVFLQFKPRTAHRATRNPQHQPVICM